MKEKSQGKAVVYILFLIAGVGLGFFFGGSLVKQVSTGGIRSLFRGHPADTVTIVASQSSAGAQTQQASFTNDQIASTRSNAIVAATKMVAPCVVGIVVTQMQMVRSPYAGDDFFDFFFGPDMQPSYRQVESIGSGFVIHEDGIILTNFHVVQNAAKLYVNFSDGRRLEGSVIGVDDRADIAVVKLEGEKFSRVRFGNADQAMIGEWAIAIGNPFLNFINDAHPTVTVGVVSALNRNFAPSEGVYYQGMIQTDAAINPGNSGGPLVNALGEVIGINTFIYTGSKSNKGSIGIGFAIPINRARRVAQELVTFGKRRQVWTGISVQDLNRSLALTLGYDGTEGVAIVNVQPGSPGAKAGLRTGDVITRMGSRVIGTHVDIDGFFLDYLVGDTVKMAIVKKGKQLEVFLTLSEYRSAK